MGVDEYGRPIPKPDETSCLGCLAVIVGVVAANGALLCIYMLLETEPKVIGGLLACIAVLGGLFALHVRSEKKKDPWRG